MHIIVLCLKLEEKQLLLGLIALHKQRSIVQSRLKYVSTVVLMLSYVHATVASGSFVFFIN